MTLSKKNYSLLVFLGLCTIQNTSHCAQPTQEDTLKFGFILGVATCASIYGIYSIANAKREATTRMRAADERLARERQKTEEIMRAENERLKKTRERIQQAEEAARNGNHQRAQTLIAQDLLDGLDPRMQAMAREGQLTHISFSQAMLAQDLLRTR